MTLTRVRRSRDERVNGAPVDLEELCRLAAREMIAVALEAERRAYLDAHAEVREEAGRRLVVGNGYAREREVTTAGGVATPFARHGQATSRVVVPIVRVTQANGSRILCAQDKHFADVPVLLSARHVRAAGTAGAARASHRRVRAGSSSESMMLEEVRVRELAGATASL